MPGVCSSRFPSDSDATPPTLCRYQPFLRAGRGFRAKHFLVTIQTCLIPWDPGAARTRQKWWGCYGNSCRRSRTGTGRFNLIAISGLQASDMDFVLSHKISSVAGFAGKLTTTNSIFSFHHLY